MCKNWSSMSLHMVQLRLGKDGFTLCDMNLPRIRKARGLSQSDLADMIGMDTATVSRAESMNKTAKLETYQLCAKALGITLADIFCDSMESIESELIAAYRASPESHQVFAGLIDMAKARAQASGQPGDQAPPGSVIE